MATVSPMLSGDSFRAGLLLACLDASVRLLSKALSRASANSDHTLRGVMGFGRWSFIGRPKSSSAGEAPISGDGMFLCNKRAFATAFVSNEPLLLMFVVSMRLIVFTAASALPLLCA